MTRKRETTPAPGLLETFAQAFDQMFLKWNQRESFRRYLEGLLLPAERNKTLTGLANTAPGSGAQHARAQSMQWFLSESNWDERLVNEMRHKLIRQTEAMAPKSEGVLIIDETGDLKDGSHTAHVGRQYLGNVGKIGNGVVSVSSHWPMNASTTHWKLHRIHQRAGSNRARKTRTFEPNSPSQLNWSNRQRQQSGRSKQL